MMSMMRCHQMLTDVVLEVGSELFHSHKVVLAAASPYFKAMFTSGLMETEMSRVTLHGVCPSAMSKLLEFIYTGKIRVTETTVCTLLPAAAMFQVADVIKACCIFLERQLSPSNAIGIASFAEQHGCLELKNRVNQYVLRNFSQVCQEDEFLTLSAAQLVDLIKKDELIVREEREVYTAVIRWVRYSEEARRPQMQSVLSAVRCQFLTPRFLHEQMRNCDVIRKLPACREYLASIFKDLTLHKKVTVRERTPDTPRIIYIAGGYFKYSLDIMESFNVTLGTWSTLAKLTIPRSGLGCAFIKGMFYAVGGRNNAPGGSYDSDWVDRYDPLRDLWRPCNPMSVPRNRVGVGVLDGLIYACGGSAGAEYHNSVERYDPEEDRWCNIKQMSSKRLGVGVAVVNRLLYAIGGFDGERRLNSCECYHPERDEWTSIPDMAVPRSGAGVAALNHHIYVVGGYDGVQQLNSVERYDTETRSWQFVAALTTARSAITLTPIDDNKLIAIGGFDGQGLLSLVEIYSAEEDKWSESASLPSARSGHAAAISFFQVSCPFFYVVFFLYVGLEVLEICPIN
ncbi:hypothetical protein AAG570_005184 [Ranatra chinensis]|uniref:Kelch-like protein diablo n=1 Tax=Ranatra chinensis TaxID=642074 RepID=A0ABD0Y0M1_9HEMI